MFIVMMIFILATLKLRISPIKALSLRLLEYHLTHIHSSIDTFSEFFNMVNQNRHLKIEAYILILIFVTAVNAILETNNNSLTYCPEGLRPRSSRKLNYSSTIQLETIGLWTWPSNGNILISILILFKLHTHKFLVIAKLFTNSGCSIFMK